MAGEGFKGASTVLRVRVTGFESFHRVLISSSRNPGGHGGAIVAAGVMHAQPQMSLSYQEAACMPRSSLEAWMQAKQASTQTRLTYVTLFFLAHLS
jgi:NADPH:quinone reductase-like Zn-dependent oxidoreductase